jgi:hypothetical protein
MIFREMMAEMFTKSRGRPLSMPQVMRNAKIHGYAHASVYNALKRMLAAGFLTESGGYRSRVYHSTPTTLTGAPPKKPGRAKRPKVKKPKAAPAPRGCRDDGPDQSPFVHNTIPQGKWAVPPAMASATRWIFDLGGRA